MAVLIVAVNIIGCGKNSSNNQENLFTLGKIDCSKSEAKVFLLANQMLYEKVLGSGHLDQEAGSLNNAKDLTKDESANSAMTLKEVIKEKSMSELIRIKCLLNMAKEDNTELTKEESNKADSNASKYFKSLSKEEKEYINLEENDLKTVFEDYTLAMKEYSQKTKDIKCDISKDDAKTISIEEIFWPTTTLSKDGKVVKEEKSMIESIKKKMEGALSEIESGSDFSYVAGKYNQASKSRQDIYLGDNVLPEDIEKEAFKLKKDEVSKLLKSKDGYYIIKCVETDNKELSEKNYEKMLKDYKESEFEKDYETFLDSLSSNLNEKEWKALDLMEATDTSKETFFDFANIN